MSLDHRLRELEKKMQVRLRRKAEVDRTWQWRYRCWYEKEGWSFLPPADPAVTLDQFKQIWRQADDPHNRPSRRSRRPPKSGDPAAS